MTSRPWSVALLVILTSIGGAARAQPIGTDMAPGAPVTPQAPLAPGAPLVNIAPPVGAVGIPLGSTELGFRGLSPLGSAAATGSAAAGSAACLGAAASGESPAPLFDGGGTGMSGDPCAASSDSPPVGSSFTATGTGAPASGGTGIPLGSVETAPAGLSPPPAVPAVPSSLPPPMGGTQPCMSAEMPMPAGSC